MNVIFLGPPGSGKGTQAKKVAGSYKLVHLSTGDVFREAMGQDSGLGQEIRSFVNAGKLVPDELVSEVVFDKLRKMPKETGVLLDGYPRTVEQAKALDAFSVRENFGIDSVIVFEVDFPELVKRLSARRSCPKCKEVFNLVNRPPKKADVCDACGSTLIQRDDDKPDVVRERLNVYMRQTEPILAHYAKHAGFHRVNAAQDIENVYRDIATALGAK